CRCWGRPGRKGAGEMERRRLVKVVVVLVVLGGLFYVFNPFRTHFVYDGRFGAGDERQVFLNFQGLRDTNVTVRFVNDTSLMYHLELDLYDPSTKVEWIIGTSPTYHDAMLRLHGRARALTVLLGTRSPYGFVFSGAHLNMSMVYDNGAVLGDNIIRFSFSGRLYLTLTEDVVVRDGPSLYFLGKGTATSNIQRLDLTVDLPEGLDGYAKFGTYSLKKNYVILHQEGWNYEGYDIYSTPDRPLIPNIIFALYAMDVMTYAWLSA
ncbi:MAG: hypothetical protein ACTSYX_05615, partial [Candidatus Thorarchaeota archaeon]